MLQRRKHDMHVTGTIYLHLVYIVAVPPSGSVFLARHDACSDVDEFASADRETRKPRKALFRPVRLTKTSTGYGLVDSLVST